MGRLRGFRGRQKISKEEVLWLKPCFAVHTLGMHVNLSLLFLDSQHRLVRIVPTARPGRFFVCWQASSVLEIAARPDPEILDAWRLISTQLKKN